MNVMNAPIDGMAHIEKSGAAFTSGTICSGATGSPTVSESSDSQVEDSFDAMCEELDDMGSSSCDESSCEAGSEDSDECSTESGSEGSDECSTESGSGEEQSAYTGTCSSDYDDTSDANDEEYDELMADLPIALGRTGAVPETSSRPMVPAPLPPRPLQPRLLSQSKQMISTLPPVTEGLPCLPLPGAEISPNEGLAMLQNIRAELEQVGRMIVAKKDGEKFLQRAHILASINWLATNVPACVLDHLGKEIRASLEIKAKKNARLAEVHVVDDDMSDASDLSEQHESDSEVDSESDSEMDCDDCDDDFVLPGEPNMRRPEPTVSWNPANSAMAALNRSKTQLFLDRANPDRKYERTVSMSTTEVTTDSNNVHSIPSVQYFQCALMFVDISGFTKLATRLDPENLSKVINSYFQKIVNKVFEFDGDIQKFAGDALFAEWRASAARPIEDCVEAAAACATSMVKDCADFPVMAFGGIFADSAGGVTPMTSLNVHCGLGVGEMAGIHVGDNTRRREYIYLGDPIKQATAACNLAQLGEAMASRRFRMLLNRSLLFSTTIDNNPLLIARRDTCDETTQRWLGNYSKLPRNAKSRGITDHVDGLQVDALIEYRRLMSLYVHPVVLSNDVAASNDFKTSATSQERRREEAELRSVFVTFINPLVPLNLTGDAESDGEAVEMLNNIMNIVTKELKRYSGHLRQFIVDDKGLVLIATFGLRGSTFPNMVSERALPAIIMLHSVLQMELGIDSRMGATFGDVYCGAVGGEKRHEYSVMGPSVNLAARLMASPENPGILVDNAVRRMASRTYGFNALEPVVAKGYKEPVPIFEPLSPLERTWGRVEANFVGRQNEMNRILTVAKEMARLPNSDPKLVLISGSSGMGKSVLLAHSIEHVRKMMGHSNRARKGLMIAKHVSRETESLVPFSALRMILLKVLTNYRGVHDDKSCDASLQTNAITITGDSLADRSHASSTVMTARETADVLGAVCHDLNAPPAHVDQIKTFLLETESTHFIPQKPGAAVMSKRQMLSFLVQIFKRCTQDARLIIVALDDAHRADEMSWKAFRHIFETADNVLMIGTTYSTSEDTLRIEQDFWEALNQSYIRTGRFVQMHIDCLNKSDIEAMTMKALGLQQKDVTAELLNEVLAESGGMPQFAKKILEAINHRSSQPIDAMTDGGTEVNESVSAIILHRVDSLDTTVRNVLNVGAIMGKSFTFNEVFAVLTGSSDAKEADLRAETIAALAEAVKEGILNTPAGADSLASECNDDTSFSFCQHVWHSTLVGLMLDSRKRDVHRKIAQSMASQVSNTMPSLDFQKKLTWHWRSALNTAKATESALSLCKMLSDAGNHAECIEIFAETLKMWNWDQENQKGTAGFDADVLEFIGASDLGNVISIMVALSRSHRATQEHTESIAMFENALKVLAAAKSAPKLRDRSVIFPAFIGLVDAIKDGHITQDVYCRYEQSLLRRFLEETRIHGRLIHHIHALYLQTCLYSRQAELDKAVAVQSVIKNLYKIDKHSRGLRNVYGQDTGAISFGCSAFWHMLLGSSKQGLRVCRQVLKEIIPKLEHDFQQSFAIMYPLALVFGEAGYTTEARAFFDKVVTGPFQEIFAQNMENPTSLVSVYKPLMLLFELSSKNKPTEDKLNEYYCYAADISNISFDPIVNLQLGRMARCGDSIGAEICCLIASKLPDGMEKVNMITQGLFLADKATAFNRKHGLKSAQKTLHAVNNKLRALQGSGARFHV